MSLSGLSFGQDDALSMPPLPAAFLQCTPAVHAIAEDPFSKESQLPFAASKLYLLSLASSRILCEGDKVKTTVEILIDSKECDHSYLPGDTIGICPENRREEVKAIFDRLQDDYNDKVVELGTVEGSKKKFPGYLPKFSTAGILLTRYLEIRGVVKKGFLRVLAEQTADSKEKRRLNELCSREGSEDYQHYFIKNGLCILDILEAFTSCRPTLSTLLEHLPRLTPRAYSIASSPLESKETIRIVFNVVTTTSQRHGVCSSWLYKQTGQNVVEQLENLSLKESGSPKIPVYFRQPTKFRVPTDSTVSMIMIGPGTGISPFIGFLEHRRCQYRDSPKSDDTRNIAISGCRYKTHDIYRDKLEEFQRENVLNEIYFCYSRDDSANFKYVQDLFYSEKESICRLLTDVPSAYLFVCGDAKNMAKDVHDVIVKSIAETKDLSLEEASSILKGLETSGRYMKDVWR